MGGNAMKTIFCKIFFTVFTAGLLIHWTGTGVFAFKDPFKLFGRDLDVKGSLQTNLDVRTHRDVRDIQFSSWKQTLRVEGDYRISRTDDLDISLYALAHYYYDFGGSIDDNQRDAIRHEDDGSHALKNYRRSNEIEEILKELYLDIRGRTWEVRIGRQIVSWGETAFFQVADIINPLDLTNMKVWPDFDDLKVGLWMVRLFYTPERMWQNISFEVLLIPPDFQHQRMPPAGHGLFLGNPPMPDNVFGQLIHHMEHDKPGNDWNNFEWGVRIRGYTWDTDWTLSYFRSRVDAGLVARDRGLNQMLNLIFGMPVTDRIFRFPKYHSAGFTFARSIPAIKSTVRGEMVLNFSHYQYGMPGTASDIKSRKLLVTALAVDRSIFVPWLTPLNRMRYLSATITWYHYKLIGHKFDKNTGEYIDWGSGNRDSSRDVIDLMLDYGFYWDYILPTFMFAYDFNGTTTLSYVLKYAPGDHWRYQVSYQQSNEQGRGAHMQDQVMFSIQYEF